MKTMFLIVLVALGFFVASVNLSNLNNETVEVTQLGITLYQITSTNGF